MLMYYYLQSNCFIFVIYSLTLQSNILHQVVTLLIDAKYVIFYGYERKSLRVIGSTTVYNNIIINNIIALITDN